VKTNPWFPFILYTRIFFFLRHRRCSSLKVVRRTLKHYSRYDLSPRCFGQLMVQFVLEVLRPFYVVCDRPITVIFILCHRVRSSAAVRPVRRPTAVGIVRRELYSPTFYWRTFVIGLFQNRLWNTYSDCYTDNSIYCRKIFLIFNEITNLEIVRRIILVSVIRLVLFTSRLKFKNRIWFILWSKKSIIINCSLCISSSIKYIICKVVFFMYQCNFM